MGANADDKHRELAKSINEGTAPGVQVVYLGDTNHFRHAEVYGAFTNKPFWDEMSHNGKTNILAVEKYSTTMQPLFDAFYKKEITRDEFMSAFDFGNNSGQMTATEDKQVVEGLADVMEKGIRVVPANNVQGLGGENMLRAQGDASALTLDRIHWLRENRNEIEKDPTAAVLLLMHQDDAQIGSMSKLLHEDYIQTKRDILDKMDNKEPITINDAAALYDVTNPHYSDYLEHSSKAEPINIEITNRRARDDQVVATIQQAAEEPNSRVFFLYGVAHAGGPDGIMAQLRQNGLQAELVVPYLGKDHFGCMKPDNKACMQLEENSKVMEDFIKNSLRSNDYLQIPDINAPLTKVEHKAAAPIS